MRFSAEEIAEAADALGFRRDSLEKVARLVSLLERLRTSSFLRSRVALKGGTALNLFLFDVPRLSVDIDLNYIGSRDRDTMLADKPKIEQAIEGACRAEGLTVRRIPSEHAGGKWIMSYTNVAGTADKLEVDVNFMLRVPLWPVAMVDSRPLVTVSATEIAVLDPHELAAGKLAALCARRASRDCFDARELLRRGDLDREKLRLGFVIYGGINRVDWRAVTVDAIGVDTHEVRRELVPMLRAEARPSEDELAIWIEALVRETRELMSAVLPLAPHELEFLERLNGQGEIAPELLTDDVELQDRLRAHPGLLWKAHNVRNHVQNQGGTP